MTNPFAPQVPAQEQASANPFAPAGAPSAQAPQGFNPQQAAAPAATAPAPNPFAAPAQQQTPQGHAPQQQAQSYVPPAGVSHMQHVQNTYQQQAAPPALGAVTAAPPPVVSDGKGATLPHMYGRLVLMFPQKLETVPRRPEHITAEQRAAGNVNQERLTATVVVLDDGRGGMQPISYGGKPWAIGGAPDTESSPLPYLRRGMWINQSRLISQLIPYLPQGGTPPGVVCGRVSKAGPNNNDPWYLTTATEQELALANQYMQLVAAGQYPHPLA